MTDTTTLTITNGIKVVTPDSLDLITPYVLQEQQDWFEDEIKFVRKLLKPGQKIIDIGANYGVYTLSMAHAVGATGCVWAFEPATSTVKLLRESVVANQFSNRIVIEQSALSHSPGTAELSLNTNSELNALQTSQSAKGETETVALVTLDECMARYQWANIDFMKMDAESEESNILKGGSQFFARHSPLVLYEIKAGESLQLDLVKHFEALGYHSYRLVPGQDVLIPFDTTSTADGYLLNLFCCKHDRAKQLEDQGFLVTKPTDADFDLEPYHWRHTLAQLPYGKTLTALWQQTVEDGQSQDVETALALYAASQAANLSHAKRVSALAASFNSMKKICESDPSFLRLASMARVARDFGERSLAVHALQKLSTTIEKLKWMDPAEPFLVPCERFETSHIQTETFGGWLVAATLEELERLAFFSSFYSGKSTRQRLETIRKLGFADAAMLRRLELVKRRAGVLV
jgi:FkbM family methyltransferase